MREHVVHFGPEGTLMGVLSTPETPRAGAPAVILLNAGMIHRVGPNRMYVTLARRLAAAGAYAFRFDLSGIGDSPMAEEGIAMADQVQSDIRDAMEAVTEQAGCDRFVMAGLCSGALAAHVTAVQDPRVVGCAQIDGPVYSTTGYRLRRIAPKIADPGAWLRFVQTRFQADQEGSSGPEHFIPLATEPASREVFAKEVAGLVERGTSLLFVITGGGPVPVNYARQLHDCLPEVDLDRHATVLYLGESDHTFTIAEHRERMFDQVMTWVGAIA